jgi:hypothetical protein
MECTIEPSSHSQLGRGGLAPEEPDYVVPLKPILKKKPIARKKAQTGGGGVWRTGSKTKPQNKAAFKTKLKLFKKKPISRMPVSKKERRKKDKGSKKSKWSI